MKTIPRIVFASFASLVVVAVVGSNYIAAAPVDPVNKNTNFLRLLDDLVGKRIRTEKVGTEYIITLGDDGVRKGGNDDLGKTLYYNSKLLAVGDDFITINTYGAENFDQNIPIHKIIAILVPSLKPIQSAPPSNPSTPSTKTRPKRRVPAQTKVTEPR